MKVRRAAVASLALGLLVLAGCASLGSNTRVQAGESAKALGEQFLATSKLYDALKTEGALTEAEYQEWRVFVPRFQATFNRAVLLWKASEDEAALIATINALKTELIIYVIRAQRSAS